VAGVFAAPPRGIILHGSRSGRSQPVDLEFDGTRRYAVNEPNGYGWSATVGEDAVSIHMAPDQWGWNARGASSHYLAVEFAQGTGSDPITDGQVRAFCWLVRAEWVPRWTAPRSTEASTTARPMCSAAARGQPTSYARGFRPGSPI
jgi:hypothetical protein